MLKAAGAGALAIELGGLGADRLYFDGNAEVLYTENENQFAAVVELRAGEGYSRTPFTTASSMV